MCEVRDCGIGCDLVLYTVFYIVASRIFPQVKYLKRSLGKLLDTFGGDKNRARSGEQLVY